MIYLTREVLEPYMQDGHTFWKLKVVATSSGDVSPKIFVYHASMNDDKYDGDVFEAVASVPQISEIPEDAPMSNVGGSVLPYYRTDTLICSLPSPAEANQLWFDVKEDTQELYDQLTATGIFYANCQ